MKRNLWKINGSNIVLNWLLLFTKIDFVYNSTKLMIDDGEKESLFFCNKDTFFI